MNKILKLLNILQPIGFAIAFLLIFSSIIYFVDKKLSEEKLATKMEYLSIDIVNHFREELMSKLPTLLADSLVQYWLVDTTVTINMLGINTKDTSAKIPGCMVGYIKVRYSDAPLDYSLVDLTKMYLGENLNTPYEEQISINPNGLPVYPHLLMFAHPDSALIADNVMKFMNDNIEFFHQYNKDVGGKRRYLYLEVNDFGTEKLYLPLIIPASRKVVDEKTGINMTFIQLLRYVLYPLDNFMGELLKHNIDITVKYEWHNKYMYGDSITAEKLLNKPHGHQMTVCIDRGNDMTITFAPNKEFPREWTFFPTVYIILVVISVLFCLTLWFFLKQIKQREVALKQREVALTQSNTELKIANNTKDKFFSIIAHDLRNPIMAMLNIATVFDVHYHKMSASESKESINILIKATTHLSKMLENLLQWSSVSVGSIETNILKNKIDSIVYFTFRDIELQAQSKDITLIFEDNTVADVYCDIDMINTILRNLISNAIKFSEKGKKIIVKTNDYSEDNRYIVVTVKDEGVGMNPNMLNKLFQLNTKFTTTGTSGESGTGLGLILCKEFIDKHNCKIWVESEIGIGTEFKFTLLKC